MVRTRTGRLSTRAASALEDAIATGGTVGVSAFSIVELVYAFEKATNPLRTEDLDVIVNALRDPDGPFEVVDIDTAIAAGVASVPRHENADPGDRLVVATAEASGVPTCQLGRADPGDDERRGDLVGSRSAVYHGCDPLRPHRPSAPRSFAPPAQTSSSADCTTPANTR